MPRLLILGSAAAVADAAHENTSLALVGQRLVLVDCIGNPLLRLGQMGANPAALTDIILTHFHPDHVSDAPRFLMNLWLVGRQEPLVLHGLAHTLTRLQANLELYDWRSWPGMYPVTFHTLPEEPLMPLLEDDELRILASPVEHLIPTIGLRIDCKTGGKRLAYSCDTAPSERVVTLAQAADVLLHEATGDHRGHSSPAQAGEVARKAGARSLYLIHYPPQLEAQAMLAAAQAAFGGPVSLAQDGMRLDF